METKPTQYPHLHQRRDGSEARIQIAIPDSLPPRRIPTPTTSHHLQSPARYVDEGPVNEKGSPQTKHEIDSPRTPASRAPSRQSSLQSRRSSPRPSSPLVHPRSSSPFVRSRPSTPRLLSSQYPTSNTPSPSSLFASPQPSLHSNYAHAPRRLRFYALIKPWIPLLLYLSTSLGFLLAIAFWKTEVFEALERLSAWLKDDAHYGVGVLFCLIFLTTFPPLPMYSTLIVLAGYTFGAWRGALISYCAALSGAVVVFLLSRYLFRDAIARWLACSTSVTQVVRAIEKRPKLLFFIRLAPYPYNVMNCLLAASPTLTLRTYAACTALSLFKVIIHTTLGASIHSFTRYHVTPAAGQPVEEDAEGALRYWSTLGGIVLCVTIFIYISYMARKAVRGELEDGDALPSHTDEEAAAFLSPRGSDDDGDGDEREGAGTGGARDEARMSETPFSAARPAAVAAAAALSGSARGWSPQRASRAGGAFSERFISGAREEEDIGLH